MLERLNEARDIADELGDVELRSEAMNWRVSSLVAAGDLGSARREIEEVRETAERTAQPFHVHVAEHCGSAIAFARDGWPMPRRWPCGRTSGAGS